MSATTAAWVSRFYEVDAKLETTANERLLPLEHSKPSERGSGTSIDGSSSSARGRCK